MLKWPPPLPPFYHPFSEILRGARHYTFEEAIHLFRSKLIDESKRLRDKIYNDENENSLDDLMEESLDLSSEKKEEVERPNINN